MPQTLSEQVHRRSSSAPMPPTETLDLSPLDVDDSIVLSDLLRTGEASRLRRRGAMRIDHNHNHHTTTGGHLLPGPPRLSSPNIVLVERSNWDSDSDIESPSFSYWNNDPPNRFSRRHPRSSRRFGPYGSSGIGSSPQGAKDEYVYSLVCGSEVADCESDHVDPFTPSILPLYPPPSPSASTSKRSTKKSTGCGTVVHTHAAPKSRFRMWTAKSPASETVIPLDACYFDAKEASRFTRSPCGCVTEGVGCAAWYVLLISSCSISTSLFIKSGNPLGTRYTPCKSASEGFFCPRLADKQPSTSPLTTNPYQNDWSSPKSHHSKPNRSIYTFFPDAVSPTPSFSFPPPPVRPSRSRSIESRPVSPISPPFVPPERYIYSPYDEEESDSENYPPYVTDNSAAWGWPIPTVPPNPPVSLPLPSYGPGSAVPRDGTLVDRPIDAPPLIPEGSSWGVSPPSPILPLRTRTGRMGRWSSIGRPFPSLSSGLGGTTHDDRPMSPISFYDRQLIAASEREFRDGRPGDVTMVDSGNDIPAATPAALDPDGELVVWGSSASDTGTEFRYVSDTDGEYKPADYFFNR